VSRQIRRPITVLLVSMLLVALAAGAALAANVNGTAGADIIGPLPYKGTSLSGDDVIRALAGNDRVSGSTGNDKIYGGEGDDPDLRGSVGNDTVKGQNGDDTIDLALADTTPNSVDKGFGGAGDDVFKAEDGNKDYIDCGTGDDTVENFDDGLDVVKANCE
jgi:Ca2+-binding RTX toxin-like protein